MNLIVLVQFAVFRESLIALCKKFNHIINKDISLEAILLLVMPHVFAKPTETLRLWQIIVRCASILFEFPEFVFNSIQLRSIQVAFILL